MVNDIDMLGFLCQDAEMGCNAIAHVLKSTEDERLRTLLKRQEAGYRDSFDSAGRLLREKGGETQHANPMAKLMVDVSSDIKTLVDSSSSHIAEMVIQGNTMGITTLTEQMHKYENGDSEIRELLNAQLQMGQRNIDDLKEFL